MKRIISLTALAVLVSIILSSVLVMSYTWYYPDSPRAYIIEGNEDDIATYSDGGKIIDLKACSIVGAPGVGDDEAKVRFIGSCYGECVNGVWDTVIFKYILYGRILEQAVVTSGSIDVEAYLRIEVYCEDLNEGRIATVGSKTHSPPPGSSEVAYNAAPFLVDGDVAFCYDHLYSVDVYITAYTYAHINAPTGSGFSKAITNFANAYDNSTWSKIVWDYVDVDVLEPVVVEVAQHFIMMKQEFVTSCLEHYRGISYYH